MIHVLHVFYTFFPDVTGSSVRSAGILAGQQANGLMVTAVSSPFQPGFGAEPIEEFRGVRCHRTYRPGHPLISERGAPLAQRVKKLLLFPGFVRAIRRIVRSEGITHLHAHSTFYAAAAALIVARTSRIHVTYEFRSLWEERARAKGPSYRMQTAIASKLETLCLTLVDRVVTINEGLRDVLIHRGIPAQRIVVVPNAVEDAILTAGDSLAPPTRARRFAYVGNLSEIEGLDLLIDAFVAAFPADRGDVSLALHGTGPLEKQLGERIAALRDPRIRLHGRFGRDDILRIYDAIDCIVIPRRRSAITEAVTPLKPLEAMAHSRAVLVSDVAGLVEVTGGAGQAKIVAADDIDALAQGLRDLAADDREVQRLAAAGRRFTTSSRNWNGVAAGYARVYD